MAYDWIKMRTDLYRDPKVCAIADVLMDKKGELASYVNQNMQRDMAITRNVTRNAACGALLSVWGVMRRRGKRVNDDLELRDMMLAVIDDVADLPGFGDAMASVGWVVETDNGIVFPNFFEEHNVEPDDSGRSKAAERQARYRERLAKKSNATSDVTSDVTLRPREEKRRDIKKEPSRKRAEAAGMEIDTWLDSLPADVDPIPSNDPIIDYASKAGIPLDYLELAWGRFAEDYRNKRKRQKDWQATFRNAVKGNWGKLWWFTPEGECRLTTAGEQAKRAAS